MVNYIQRKSCPSITRRKKPRDYFIEMADTENLILTKTDFMRYLEAPMHLWAEKHSVVEVQPSPYELHTMEQGKEIHSLAKAFLKSHLLAQNPNLQIMTEQTHTDGPFLNRADMLVFDPEAEVFDLYEIKSSSSVKTEHKYDMAFQALVCETNIPLRNPYLVHVNKEYVKDGSLDLAQFFVIEDLRADIEKLRAEVTAAREDALQMASNPISQGIAECLKPKECICLTLCHPDLPEYPIFDLTRLHKNKAMELKSLGISSILDIPVEFKLTDLQSRIVAAVKNGEPFIDHKAITAELERLEYPLYFLDYESYNPAVPIFDGYKPYQHIVFQYSLHVIEEEGSEIKHVEYLDTDPDDPAPRIVEHLAKHLGKTGSVIVWYRPFEATRNGEMAERYPQHVEYLLGINDRIFDLMEIVSKGHYVHPDFHGSASIKDVLPVLAKEYNQRYKQLAVSNGQDAMLAWMQIMSGSLKQEEIETSRQNLVSYCELDTIAMIKIYEALVVHGR